MKRSCLQHASMLECACHIISYLADVMNALRQSSGQGSSQLLMEGEEKAIEVDSDWVEELAVEEEDSQAEDSVSKFAHCKFKDFLQFFQSYLSFLCYRMRILSAISYAPSPSHKRSS